MVWPLVAAAVGSLIGGLVSNSSARKEAKKNRAFQERMSNTEYQRSVVDMRAAGINPMLAFMKGGASTPPGATAQQHDPVSPAVNTAITAIRTKAELENLLATNENIQVNTNRELTQAALNKQLAVKTAHEADTAATNAKAAELALQRQRQQSRLYEGKPGGYRTEAEWWRSLIFGGSPTIGPVNPNK